MAEEKKSRTGGVMRIILLIITGIIVIILGILTLKKQANSDGSALALFATAGVFMLCLFLIIKAIYLRHRMNRSLKNHAYNDKRKYRDLKRKSLEQLYPWIAILLGIIALLQNTDTNFLNWIFGKRTGNNWFFFV